MSVYNQVSHLVDSIVITEHHHTDVVCLQVERHTLHTALEAHKLTGLGGSKRGKQGKFVGRLLFQQWSILTHWPGVQRMN